MSTILNRTPTANLEGTITQAENTSGQSSIEKAGFGASATGKLMPTSAGTNEASVVVTTPADSAVIISAFAFYENDGGTSETLNIRILDGSTTLESTSKSVGAGQANGIAIVHVDASPLSGSRTYNVQSWSPGAGILIHVSITVTHVQFTDTHVAVGKAVNSIIKG